MIINSIIAVVPGTRALSGRQTVLENRSQSVLPVPIYRLVPGIERTPCRLIIANRVQL
jgi:hypothetical protein